MFVRWPATSSPIDKRAYMRRIPLKEIGTLKNLLKEIHMAAVSAIAVVTTITTLFRAKRQSLHIL